MFVPRLSAITRGAVTCLGVILAFTLIGAPTASAGTLPAITIAGNQFMAGGKVVRLIGVNRSGTEYSCTPTDDDGIFQGPVDQGSVTAMLSWDINVVQLPLNEACWLGSPTYTGLDAEYTGASYQQAIENYVNLLNANGIYVSLNLSGAAPNNNVFTPGDDNDYGEAPLADSDHSVAFWTSVATAFKANDDVLFHVYDEPNSLPGTEDAQAWACVENGCTVDDPRYGSYTGVGSQALVTAIRAAGATAQPILVSGANYAGDLSQWLTHIPTDPSHEIGAVIDSFDYTDNFCPSDSGSCDDQSQNMATVAASHPVVIGGFGDGDCPSTTGFSDALMNFADQNGISYIAWTWDTDQDYGTCNNALLSGDDSAYEDGNPSTYGAIIRTHYQAVAAAAATATGGGNPAGSSNPTGSSSPTGSANPTGSSAPPAATPPTQSNLTAPQNTAAPVISGTLVVGRTLGCSAGSWLASPTSFTYQWLRGARVIAGATRSTYVITRADQGHGLACAVTASNGLTAHATSRVRAISAPGTLGRVSVGPGTVSAVVACGSSNASSCEMTVSLSASIRLAATSATVKAGARRTLKLELTPADRRRLAGSHDVAGRLRLTDRVGRAAALQIASVRVKLKR